ncbi:MupG family TIM beta-alpha barrel fold protein [Irregularibacter muris]|uniref:MupG family TIM beta-alpha barrel fold protein n=1 Tax=Irregularibacter muris TaxID=1796619 RepID=A0AAE3HGL7_9FIRM|nr:MupG family TIM beta-alpha barrel fold protein [Irregularibacter muris]MCR1900295.1 MupG family TIM beta-alpha barrel fold protein [Irregularibacter muris]
MFKQLGLSIYLFSFEAQREMLERFKGSGCYVFTSFHMQEEFSKMKDYCTKAKEMCIWLKKREFKIIGDVSSKTLEFFQYDSIVQFARDFNLDILRLDYGFSQEEMLAIAKEYPISFNPSTEDEVIARKVLDTGTEVFALHNFYPRSETGLDGETFHQINKSLKDLGIKILAFIPGDEIKRTPIYEGLPTLEKHRNIPPYVAFLDLVTNYDVDSIFVGDIKISKAQSHLIDTYLKDRIISIPVEFSSAYQYLYDQVFTIRVDSPQWIMRLQESREYSCDGEKQQPYNCIFREKGAITMDNVGYKRYSGEIQILRQSFPQDSRVNVIGRIDNDYLDIMQCVKNREKIRFIKI